MTRSSRCEHCGCAMLRDNEYDPDAAWRCAVSAVRSVGRGAMTYRTAAEKKKVKHRIVLTRGEVEVIVRARLAEIGRIPTPGGVPMQVRMAALVNVEPDKPEWRMDNGTHWEKWPALAVEWEEELAK